MTVPDRRSVSVGAFGYVSALALAGCDVAPRRDGRNILRLSLSEEPQTLTPIATTSNPVMAAKVYEGLLSYAPDLTPQPQLATRYGVSPDGLRYVFHLREGVRWHDSQPFTSADVAFSITLLREYHPIGRQAFANVAEILTPDDLTAEIVLSKPAPYLLGSFAASATPILPKHIYDRPQPLANPRNNAPVGTGPYRFIEWNRGSHIAYERNADYWDAPKPYVDGLVALIIPDPSARLIALESGAVDIAEARAPSHVRMLAKSTSINVQRINTGYNASVYRMEINLSRPTLADHRVRQAFAHAIDRDFAKDVVLFGFADACPRPVAPALTRFAVPGPPLYAFDPAAAEALLDQANFPRRTDGTRFTVTLDYFPFFLKRLAEYVQSAFYKIGVHVELRSQDQSAYVRRVYTARDFDLTVNAISNYYDPTAGVQRLYWSKAIQRGVPFTNGSGYNNPDVDALLEQAAVETDPQRRYDLFRRFQETVERDIPDINIISPWLVTGGSKRVSGYAVTADGINGNFAEVRLDAEGAPS